jgi:hypothetical protein
MDKTSAQADACDMGHERDILGNLDAPLAGPTVAASHSKVFDRIVDVFRFQERDEIVVDEHSSEGISGMDRSHCS